MPNLPKMVYYKTYWCDRNNCGTIGKLRMRRYQKTPWLSNLDHLKKSNTFIYYKIFNPSKTTDLISKVLVLLESRGDVDIDRYLSCPILTILSKVLTIFVNLHITFSHNAAMMSFYFWLSHHFSSFIFNLSLDHKKSGNWYRNYIQMTYIYFSMSTHFRCEKWHFDMVFSTLKSSNHIYSKDSHSFEFLRIFRYF